MKRSPLKCPQIVQSATAPMAIWITWGQDGTTVNVVDSAAKIGSVVNCYTCHNPSAQVKDTAIFPSGVEVSVVNPIR